MVHICLVTPFIALIQILNSSWAATELVAFVFDAFRLSQLDTTLPLSIAREPAYRTQVKVHVRARQPINPAIYNSCRNDSSLTMAIPCPPPMQAPTTP